VTRMRSQLYSSGQLLFAYTTGPTPRWCGLARLYERKLKGPQQLDIL